VALCGDLPPVWWPGRDPWARKMVLSHPFCLCRIREWWPRASSANLVPDYRSKRENDAIVIRGSQKPDKRRAHSAAVCLGVCLAGYVVWGGVLPSLSGNRADAQQMKGRHPGSEIEAIVGVRPWHLLRIVGPREIELETSVETCYGLSTPGVIKVRKVEGRKSLRITVWVKREIAGECLSESTFVRRRVRLGAPLGHRSIYDAGTNPPKRRWPE
jgi:hypothetical protein